MTTKDLKKQAEQLGISVHHRWNEETIQAKINEVLAAKYLEQAEAASEAPEAPESSEAPPSTPKVKKGRIRALNRSQYQAQVLELRKQRARELVRVQVTCMNPIKKEWQGEILSTGSAKMGTFKKYIPYNVEWHVPRALLEFMKEKKCSVFQNVPDGRGGMKKESRSIPEYSIAELPPLTPEELKALAQRQAMARGEAA
jgi:hypothetical protein